MRNTNFLLLFLTLFIFLSCEKEEATEASGTDKPDGRFEISINGKTHIIGQLGSGYDEGKMYDRPDDNRLTFHGLDVRKEDSSYVANIPLGRVAVSGVGEYVNFGPFDYVLDGDTYEIVEEPVSDKSHINVESVKYTGKNGQYALFLLKGTFIGHLTGRDSGKELPFSGTYEFKVGTRNK